jgi:catechol 2,3-dioxygenase-like lactoylglutathione lyase family enzyme
VDIHLAVVSLRAEDVPACAHFYRDLVGLQMVAHHSGDRPHLNWTAVI